MRYLNYAAPHRFVLLIIFAPLILFWRWLLKGEVIYWGTLMFQFWPWRYLVKKIALAGAWPLWNPLLGNGTPLLANLQTAIFYPPNLLYFLMPVEQALTLSTILHLSLAGLFMYGYARCINLGSFAATISALSFMFSGYIVGRTQFIPMINALVWIPLLLLLSERWLTESLLKERGVNKSSAYRRLLGLGLVLAVQLLAGHAQTWFYSLCLLGAYTVFRSWQYARQTGRPLVLTLLNIGIGLSLALGLALLLAAVQILPTAEFTTQSPRSDGAERIFALTYSFWPWRLVTLIAPNFFGNPAQNNYWGYANYWEDHAYVGTLPFLLAILGVWRYFRRPTSSLTKSRPDSTSISSSAIKPQTPQPVVPFFAGLIPLSLILAMGWNTPLYLWVFDTIPGFAYFQAPSRLLIWYTVAVAVLAGIGLETFRLTPQSRPGWRRFLLACLGLTVAGVMGGVVLSGVRLTFLSATTVAGLFLAISVLLLLSRPVQPASLVTERAYQSTLKHRKRWQGTVLFFVIVDLWWFGGPLIPLIPAKIFRQPIESAAFIKTQGGNYRIFSDENFDYTTKFSRYFRFQQFGPNEVAYWQSLRETLVPNFGIYAELPSANNDDPLVVGHWQQLIDFLKQTTPEQRDQLLALMNVGYIIEGRDTAAWPTLYETEAIAIRQTPDPLPRAYFVSQGYLVQDKNEVLTRLTAADFDSRREVVIMGKEVEGFDQTASYTEARLASIDQSDEVVIGEERPNQIQLTVNAPTAGFVVLTDTFYPGWQATIQGQPVPIWPANLAFRAVAVEAGRQEILFDYRPLSFTVGLWVSIIALVATIMASIILTRHQS